MRVEDVAFSGFERGYIKNALGSVDKHKHIDMYKRILNEFNEIKDSNVFIDQRKSKLKRKINLLNKIEIKNYSLNNCYKKGYDIFFSINNYNYVWRMYGDHGKLFFIYKSKKILCTITENHEINGNKDSIERALYKDVALRFLTLNSIRSFTILELIINESRKILSNGV